MPKPLVFPYTIAVAWSPPDEAYVAKVPKLKYCVAHGGTPAAAVERAESVGNEIIRIMAKDGNELPVADFVS